MSPEGTRGLVPVNYIDKLETDATLPASPSIAQQQEDIEAVCMYACMHFIIQQKLPQWPVTVSQLVVVL